MLEEVKLFRKGNVYKIAWTPNRKDGKRHLYKAFQSESEEAAVEAFQNEVTSLLLDPVNQNRTFSLYTGDWKYIITYEQ